MRPEQWQLFKSTAKGRNRGGPVPLALIVDCPWIPAYAGISHHDYFFDVEAWLQANLRIQRDFPEVIWFPSWWSEVGMGAEPSALGTRLRFWPQRVPDVEHLPFPMDELDQLTLPDPATDGFMPLCLYRYEKLKPRIREAGFTVPVVAARGPLTIASFFRGVTELMTGHCGSSRAHLETADLTTNWPSAGSRLRSRSSATAWKASSCWMISPGSSVEALPAIRPPLSQAHLRCFPADWVKVFHNDASVRPAWNCCPTPASMC